MYGKIFMNIENILLLNICSSNILYKSGFIILYISLYLNEIVLLKHLQLSFKPLRYKPQLGIDWMNVFLSNLWYGESHYILVDAVNNYWLDWFSWCC